MERLAGVESPLPVRPVQGRPHRRARATASTRSCALILPTEKSVLFVLPWGDALDHRHHRHRRGSSAWTTRPPAAPTSTTCSTHANAILREPLTAEDITGRVRRAAAAGGRGLGRHGRRLARARGAAQRAGTRQHRRRQVHDVPHHGARRRRRGRARPALHGAAEPHGGRAPARRRRDRRRPATAPASIPARRASRPRSSTTSRAGTARWRCEVLDLVVDDPSLASAAGRRGHVPRRRGPVRGAQRGGAARGRRAHAPHAHRLRDAGPRSPRRRRRRAAHGAGAGVGRGDREPRGRRTTARGSTPRAPRRAMLDDAAADAARAPVRDVRLEHERAAESPES